MNTSLHYVNLSMSGMVRQEPHIYIVYPAVVVVYISRYYRYKLIDNPKWGIIFPV